MIIGEVAARARVNIQTVRYYERRAPTAECPILEALEEPLEHA